MIDLHEIEAIRKGAFRKAELIKKAEKNIRIYGGEGAYIYEYEEVITAFRQQKHNIPSLSIKVILGPTIYSLPEIKSNKIIKKPTLFNLARDGIIHLYCRKKRTKDNHYFIIDDGKYSEIQAYHPVLAPFNQRKKLKVPKEHINELCNIFDALINNNKVIELTDPDYNCLLLSYGDFQKIKDFTNQNKIEFDDLEKEEVEKILYGIDRELNDLGEKEVNSFLTKIRAL